MWRVFLRRLVLLASASTATLATFTIGGCGNSPAEAGSTCVPSVDVAPAIEVRAVLPDLDGLGSVDCGNGGIDAVKARSIYDAFFGPRMPKTEADFAFRERPELLSVDLVHTVSFPSVYGQDLATYHALFSFDPAIYQRPASARITNVALFATFGRDPEEPYKRVNVLDYVPAALTHYARTETAKTDIMATQFVFRLACNKREMTAALSACPDCVDSFAPLSKDDIGRILELRFARTSKKGTLEVSRPFRVIGVDSSGAIVSHATKDLYPYLTVNGTPLRSRWRGELSGKMALALGTYGGPTPSLIRAGIGPAPGTEVADAGADVETPPKSEPAPTPATSTPSDCLP